MTQFNIKDEFVKSLITLSQSSGKFFNVKLPSNEILKININSSSCNWVLEYKYNLIKEAKNFKKKFKINVSDEIFLLFYYFYYFVMPDILMLKKFLPKQANQILDIGAGIGFFEIFLNHLYGPINSISIIEENNLLKIEHHKKSKKIKKLNKPLHVIDLAKEFLENNNASNITFIDSNNVYNKSNIPYDLVISIRSWGFLYDLDEYLDFVNNNLISNATVIADINKRTNDRNKFEKNFDNVQVIHEYEAHSRLIGIKE